MRLLDWEFATVLLTVLSGLIGIIFYISEMNHFVKEGVNLQKQVGKDIEEIKVTMIHFENAGRNTQIRLYDVEEWAESNGYKRVNSKTDFDK